MHEGQPSATALFVAIHRAAHQLLDRPLILDDPLALRIIGAEPRAALEKDPHSFESDISGSFLRAILAVRSRIAEEALADGVKRGTGQYVVLGAGLDTFAYRNPFPSVRVFEVDHPSTQEWKRGLLEQAGIAEPASVTYVPVDFTRQTLAAELVRDGFVPGKGAVFSWLGVTPYVTMEVVAGTLKAVAELAGPGGGVVLDYVVPLETQPPFIQAVLKERMEKLKEVGEPWQSFFTMDEMESILRKAGFTEIDDLGPAEINGRYFTGRKDGLMVGTVGRVVRAGV
jgi:methyltransferase (TIGR00027 family)